MRSGVLLAIGALAFAAGCGGEAPERPQDAVRATMDRFKRAAQQKDYAALCSRVFAPQLTDDFQQAGLKCETAMERAFAAVRSPQLSVDAVQVDGAKATARVRTSALGQEGSTDTVQLVRTADGWRISSLGSG